MKKPAIYRKRFIPFETVDISGDELIHRDENLIVTRWKAIRPRKDISGGISFTYIEKGIKISRFFDNDGKFIYWYCDIIDVEHDLESDSFTLIDLLIDVKIMPDGSVNILDADELAEALEKGLVTEAQVCSSLRKLDRLLKMIYSGEFPPAECKKEYKSIIL